MFLHTPKHLIRMQLFFDMCKVVPPALKCLICQKQEEEKEEEKRRMVLPVNTIFKMAPHHFLGTILAFLLFFLIISAAHIPPAIFMYYCATAMFLSLLKTRSSNVTPTWDIYAQNRQPVLISSLSDIILSRPLVSHLKLKIN